MADWGVRLMYGDKNVTTIPTLAFFGLGTLAILLSAAMGNCASGQVCAQR